MLQEKIKVRDSRLHEMIEQARVRPERSWRVRPKPLMRIDLRESSVLLSTNGPAHHPFETQIATPLQMDGAAISPATSSLWNARLQGLYECGWASLQSCNCQRSSY